MALSNGVYDKLKHLTQVGLPAAGALYFGLGQIWGLPAGEEVVGSLALLTTFFGVILGISSKDYDSGPHGTALVSTSADGKKGITFEFDKDPMDLIGKANMVFKVEHGDGIYWKEPHSGEEWAVDRDGPPVEPGLAG